MTTKLKTKYPVIARLADLRADAEPDCYAITREAIALFRELEKLTAPETAEPFYEGARTMVNFARPIRGVTR